MAASSGIGSLVEERTEEMKPIDREKTCPLLLRVFCSQGRHSALSEYARGAAPTNELQIYTWFDCTLRELTQLIKEVNPDARRRGTQYDFALVFPGQRPGDYRLREIGSTQAGVRGPDDNKNLRQCKFEIGDYVDVAISLPGGRGGPQRRNRPY